MVNMRHLLVVVTAGSRALPLHGDDPVDRPMFLVSELQRLTEMPPGKKAERFIKKNKAEFQQQYGNAWEQVLYATAWNRFGKRKHK